jgi:hypothetical protein
MNERDTTYHANVTNLCTLNKRMEYWAPLETGNVIGIVLTQ